jgi:hypothetical protein
MTKKRAIQIYEKNIQMAMDDTKRFSFIKCQQSCRCIVGIKFDEVSLEYGQLKCVRNGHQFKTSINLGNQLEFLYYPLLREYENIKLGWERNDTLEKIVGNDTETF